MSVLGKSDIDHVLKLSKLSAEDGDTQRYVDQLSEVVGYVDILKKTNTDKTEPTSQTTGLLNVERNDEIQSERCLTTEEALSGSDKTYNDSFKVKAILEKNG